MGSDGEFVIDGDLKSIEYVDRLPILKEPILTMAGDHDERDPSLARTMHEKIAGSKFVILPNSGHMAFENQQKLCIETVRDFVNGESKRVHKEARGSEETRGLCRPCAMMTSARCMHVPVRELLHRARARPRARARWRPPAYILDLRPLPGEFHALLRAGSFGRR